MKKSDETTASYWREQIPWYPSTVFGPYRLRGYSRRELVADGVVHAAGCVLGLAAAALLVPRAIAVATPAPRVAAEPVGTKHGAWVPGDLLAPVAGCRFVVLFYCRCLASCFHCCCFLA